MHVKFDFLIKAKAPARFYDWTGMCLIKKQEGMTISQVTVQIL